MCGYTKFSFWVPRALAKFYTVLSEHSFKPCKNIPVLISTTYKEPEYLKMLTMYTQL